MVVNKKINWKKHYYRFGISRKKYYIIRRSASGTGLFSLVNTHLGHIEYAVKHSYIPVIDMQNYENCYLEPENIGKINAWERLFENPADVDIEDAYAGKCVLLSSGDPTESRPDDDIAFFNNEGGKLDYWRELAHKYIRINSSIRNEIDIEYNKLVTKEDRVLGVLVRGTDYVDRKPYEHPVQPDINDVIEKSHLWMDQYACNKIFLATEDKEIAEKFRKEFGDAYITNERQYVEYESGLSTPEIKIDRENDCFLKGKEYLTTIEMLSRSNVFIGGRTSGTVGAFLLSNGFEHSYVYAIGRYGVDWDR